MPYTSTEKRREAQRRYYRRHREKVLAKHEILAKSEKGRADQRERNRRYYNLHKEKILLIKKERQPAQMLRRKEVEAGRHRPETCDICGYKTKRIEFDHCHQRGIFRGWLCGRCNTALGLVSDNPTLLRKLIAYLERTKENMPLQLSISGI